MKKLCTWYTDDGSHWSADVYHLCTLSRCIIVPVDEDSLFLYDVVVLVWIYGCIRAKEQVELQTMHSQQSLSCHWPPATWAASSSANLFQHNGNCAFTWANLAPVREESLIWRVTAPMSFKLDGLLKLRLTFFFNLKLGRKYPHCSDYSKQASILSVFPQVSIPMSTTEDGKTSKQLLVLGFETNHPNEQ